MSTRALARAEEAAEGNDGTRQFRIVSGYATVLDWFARQIAVPAVAIHLRAVADRIGWRQGRVRIEAETPTGKDVFEARSALVTLPLGVLKAMGTETVLFEPPLTEKQPAIEGMGMGTVTRITLQFRERFWPVENFGFVHFADALLPTWWSDPRGFMLTGWSGGPPARQLNAEGREMILQRAFEVLSRIFGVEKTTVEELLEASYLHDWEHDIFTGGAYSYTPVGMGGMAKRLAAPVDGTLFFAGEATDSEGEQGTVHGAIASGRRAAAEIIAALSN
jgi:monoamine oxidase